MTYRTKTYLAADWTGDKDLIDALREWNDSDRWALSFVDAHEYTQARDTSLPCSIKKSLAERLNVSKTFVLIVGKNTKKLTKGSCTYCDSYLSNQRDCFRNEHIDYRSYIEFECSRAAVSNMKIVVIYNSAAVDKTKCPDSLKNIGTHINGYFYASDNKRYWNKREITRAIMG